MNKKGFTLVEILVVISIIAVISLVSFPSFAIYSAQLCLNAAARTLASDLRGLQSQAILQHKTVSLAPDKLDFPAGIRPVLISNISFAASGFTPPGGSGTLVLADRFGRQKRIIVSSAGRVRIE